jgi:L-ascorbate metabolism protein UlaG (beta-lactamase superfamily)
MLPVLVAVAAALQSPDPPAAVRLTYLANEGVMLSSPRGRVLIDALFGDGLPDYAVVPHPERDSLERAAGQYGGPSLLLTTHAHRDHYDSAAVARYLASNPEAVAIGPPGPAAHGELRPADLGWVQVRPIAIPHGPTIRPVGHTWYLVTLDGTTALHLGDTNGDPAAWPSLGLPAGGVDIALVPYWYALDDARFRRLLDVIRPGTVVLLHVSLGAAKGDGGWPTRLRELQARYPRVRAPSHAGETVELAPSPGPRNAHGAVYDLRDRSLVLFGGAGTDRVYGDTWRWRDGSWRRLSGTGPAARTFPAMTYDADRGEVVLYGGNRVLFGDSTHPPEMLGDTWTLRGGRWVRAAAKGPSPRAEAAVAYDARRRRTVLFGGYDLAPDGRPHRLGDTWEWDGVRWAHVAGDGPAPRSGAAMAWHPDLGAVLFGGSGGPLNDTWRWDGRRWSRVDLPPTPGRFNTSMALDPASGRLIRYGGWDGQGRVGDTWELQEGRWVQVARHGPPARNHSVLVSAPERGSVLLYGGHDGEAVFGDMWEYKDGSWTALTTAPAPPRVLNGH